MAAEVLDAGVDFSFSPVVDLDYGFSAVIGDRSFHRDPEIVATLAVAWLQGMHKAGMIGVAKHFPGHGHVVADSHVDLPVDHRTLAELRDDMLPYERMLGHGLNAVMVAHVRYPQVDPDVASLSPYWLGTALRRDLGMRGAIFTDDLSMKALASEGEMPERARRALAAGADMALICNDPVAADATLEALQGYWIRPDKRGWWHCAAGKMRHWPAAGCAGRRTGSAQLPAWTRPWPGRALRSVDDSAGCRGSPRRHHCTGGGRVSAACGIDPAGSRRQ